MDKKIAAPKIVILHISKIKPWKGNPRKGHAVDAIAKSIETFGYTEPIIVQAKTRRVLAGHGRLEALKKLGVQEIPAIEVDLTDAQADLYTIADNSLAAASEWDFKLLSDLLRQTDSDLAEGLLCINEEEIALIHLKGAPPKKGQEDDLPPEREGKAITKRGDEWALGEHRLLCGDSTSKEDVARVMEFKADLVFTDPPYGVDYQAAGHDRIKNDTLKNDALWKFLKSALGLAAQFSVQDAAFYIWHASSTREEFAQAMKAVGLVERQYLIWVKPSITLGHADYHWQHEPCFYAQKDGGSPTFHGDRTQATVWQIGLIKGGGDERAAVALGNGLVLTDGEVEVYLQPHPPKSKKVRRQRIEKGQSALVVPDPGRSDVWSVGRDFQPIHPTQKPVELARRAIENSSRPGDIVLDPFMGSGSTLIGCEMTGRKARGLEFSEKYCDRIVERWQALTGSKATNQTRKGVTIS